MSSFVLDASVTMEWCLEDQVTEYSEQVLSALDKGEAWVPELWTFEVFNVLLNAERLKRLKAADSARFLELLGSLPILIGSTLKFQQSHPLLSLGRRYHLSAYDAAYLELAMRQGLPLATRDQNLRKACKKSGVAIFLHR